MKGYEAGGASWDWIPDNLTLHTYKAIYSVLNLPPIDTTNPVPGDHDAICLPAIARQRGEVVLLLHRRKREAKGPVLVH